MYLTDGQGKKAGVCLCEQEVRAGVCWSEKGVKVGGAEVREEVAAAVVMKTGEYQLRGFSQSAAVTGMEETAAYVEYV